MTTSLSRFQINYGNPPALPGKCAVCGTSQGTFIDFGLDLDYYGVVYLCTTCMVEVANLLEYYSPAQMQVIRNEVEELRNQLNAALDRNEELENALGSLSRLGNMSSVPRHREPVLREEPEINGTGSEGEQKDAGMESEPYKATSRRKARPTEQTNEPGSSELRSDDSLSILGDTI